MTLIIDCHGHYTTAPPPHNDWRDAQKAAFKAGEAPPPYPAISDDEIRETLEKNQLRLLRERGADMTIFSPARLGHGASCRRRGGPQGLGARQQRSDRALRRSLSRDLRRRLHAAANRPRPTSQGSIEELERCVSELGFIGCNLNPDPGGGHFTSPPLTDRYLVSLLREDGRAGRAGDDPRLGQLQSRPARDRRLLHRRRHDRLHAADRGRSVRRFPDACASSSRMAAARCPIIGAAIAAWPTC